MKENNNISTDLEYNEVSLKEVILLVQKFSKEVLRNWKLIVFVTIPFVAFMLFQAITTPTVYPANLTFMINENEGGGINGVSAILGQFGLGGGGGGKYNLDKILKLAKSRKLIKQVLLEKKVIEGKDDFLANHLITVYDLHEEWEEDTTGMATFLFTQKNLDTSFSALENKVLKSLYGKVIGGVDEPGILKTEYEKETGIMELGFNSESELLSIFLVETLYEKLSSFYVEKVTEKQKKTFDVVEVKVDSIHTLLNNKEYALANFRDSHRGLWTSKTRLKELQLTRDVQVLNILYGEALKNLEIAGFSLKNRTPFVQLIDAPISPISPVSKSKIKAIILGVVIGGFLAIVFIVIRRIYWDTMLEKNPLN